MDIYKTTASALSGFGSALTFVADLLKIPQESDEMLKQIQIRIAVFFKTIKPDVQLVIETDYVDKVYRDCYYQFYSSKLQEYNRNCVRISLFKSDYVNDFDVSNPSYISSKYLGFVIIRPLIKPIGYNCISPEAKENPSDNIKICKTCVRTTCLGVKVEAKGFPHSSQEETMTCAQTTVWAISEYYSNRYSIYPQVLPSNIHNSLIKYSAERMLPSLGLTYHQIAVALQGANFATRIYNQGDNRFKESLACYIESGIPLALCLQNDKIGHAVVCVGRKNIDKTDITKGTEIIDGKTYYVWNKCIEDIVVNDDNLPCYKTTTFDDPCAHYKDAEWKDAKITHFIAPLYPKIFMEAASAIEATNYIVEHILKTPEHSTIRTYLTSSKTYREYVATNTTFTNSQKISLLTVSMPKFVWISEIATLDNFKNDKVNTIIILDATGSKYIQSMASIIYMLSDSLLWHYDATKKTFISQPSTLPAVFNSFNGNLS